MADQTIKAFDYAQDTTKQLLTLATGVVALGVTFLKDLAAEAPGDARAILYVSWGLFALSVLAGVATLLNLSGHVEHAEASTSTGIYASGIRFFAIVQILCFVAALGCTVYFGARAFDTAPRPAASATPTPTPTP